MYSKQYTLHRTLCLSLSLSLSQVSLDVSLSLNQVSHQLSLSLSLVSHHLSLSLSLSLSFTMSLTLGQVRAGAKHYLFMSFIYRDERSPGSA